MNKDSPILSRACKAMHLLAYRDKQNGNRSFATKFYEPILRRELLAPFFYQMTK